MAVNNLPIRHRENFSVRPVEGWTEKFRCGEGASRSCFDNTNGSPDDFAISGSYSLPNP